MNQAFPSDDSMDDNYRADIRADVVGCVGVITLNRDRALNALSLEMVREISIVLADWEKNDRISVVLFKGAGERAFCSGGDLKALYKAGMGYRRGESSLRVPSLFFAEEYALNKKIYHYPKLVIGFMNGITMGGGYGIAGNCRYRVATEKTVFAMPETKIGFFPDVGSAYHLVRGRGKIGYYLALTGLEIEGADVCYAGFSDFYMQSKHYDDLLERLQSGEEVQDVLENFSVEAEASDELFKRAADIETVFAHQAVPDILKALEDNGSVWASDIFEILHQRCPASVFVTAEYLRRAQDMSIDDVFSYDFMLAQRFIERGDLYEGIRSVLLDRGAVPAWNPATLKDVSDTVVNDYFTSTGYDLSDVDA